jgi:hypothetical protein
MNLWTANEVRSAETLTKESLLKACEKIRNEKPEPHPCSRGAHLVTGRALYRIGDYRCINCGALVNVHTPLSEMHAKP